MDYRCCMLIRYGEIGLKGGNRPFFEQILAQRIADVTGDLPGVGAPERMRGRMLVGWDEQAGDAATLARRLQHVFGIVSLSPAWELTADLEAVSEAALRQTRAWLARRAERAPVPFKVDARRADKGFPHTSLDLNRILGRRLLDAFPRLEVNLDAPELVVSVEIRARAYVHTEILPGPGGLPVGSGGRAMILLSGGIDSPLAAYLTLKRGVRVEAVHFDSFPYTSERARQKVLDLSRVLARWSGGALRLHLVPFADFQTALQDTVPERFLTLVMRRMMMRVAEGLAWRRDARALVTGESLGQVASQTLDSLAVTNGVTELPVLRPLIGCDKDEITRAARRIGTFEISIRPYEDCCGLFVPERPVTRPVPREVEAAEAGLDAAAWTERLVEASTLEALKADWEHSPEALPAGGPVLQ